MNKSRYFDLAYQFRKSKIWKTVYEQELFAVKLPGYSSRKGNTEDNIAYCLLMGRGGDHTALAVYIGGEGFSTLRKLVGGDFEQMEDPSSLILTQDCIQCSLEKKEQFTREGLEELRGYCKRSGNPFRTPYPQFTRFRPYCVPWEVTEKSDWEAVEAALRVVVELAQQLRKSSKAALGLYPVDLTLHDETNAPYQVGMFDNPKDGAVAIPLFSFEGGKLVSEPVALPPYQETAVSPPPHVNEIAVAKIAKRRKKGALECEIIRVPEPIGGESEGEAPYLPAMLLSVQSDGQVLRPIFGRGAVYDSTDLLDCFIESMCDEYPRTIKVRTEETRALLADFCTLAKIRLEVKEHLDLMEEVMGHLEEFLRFGEDESFGEDEEIGEVNDEEMIEMMNLLQSMSIQQLRMMPKSMLEELLEAEEFLPPELVRKLRKARNR